MSLIQRGSVWWVDFKSPSGKRIRRSANTEDRRQAQEYHDRLKAELWRVHKLGERQRRTWQEAVVRWLKNTEHKADHGKDISKLRWLDRHLGKLYLDQITPEVIEQIAEAKKAEASASTANRYLALVRAILRMARDEWDWLEKAPFVRLYREPRKRVRWLKPEEAERLLRELPEHLADMALFSLATGLRQRNVSYLKWDQVDMERGMAWIHADQSKSGRAISVPLNGDALQVLRRRQQIRHREYVFTYKGKPVDRTSTRAWHNALARAGIQNFRWHDLRHTWASWHVQSGTSLNELMELGGWASFEMVLRYAHFAGEHLKNAACHIDGTIRSQRHTKQGLRLIVSR